VAQWIALPRHARSVVAETPGSILLETSRFDPANRYSYLFLRPLRTLVAHKLNEIPQLFSQIEDALAGGYYVAGFFSYECGYHFEPSTGPEPGSRELPLAWLGVYDSAAVFDHVLGRFRDGSLAPLAEDNQAESPTVTSDPIVLEIAPEEYYARILKIKEYIASGETYQVNFTNDIAFRTPLSALDAFDALSAQQPVAYSALMNVADHSILSLSPELFFRIDAGRIVTRPMKGTMPRGMDAAEDIQAALRLQSDEKNRSEHVMIVDLLRNDLGRICNVGSIQVEDLFSVERYETLFQMTSTISGALRPEIGYYDIFRSMFPSGSITGAPKIRTMQIIRELEQRPREVYTGAIGFMSPQGSSVFNVAIRTLVMKEGNARMGVGGGIVADSDPREEYRECQLKASFITHPRRTFQLIETMLWDMDFRFLSMHLERLGSSAEYFNFFFDMDAVTSKLRSLSTTFNSGERYRVRLTLDRVGNVAVDSSVFGANLSTGLVRLSTQHTSSSDVFLRHKTTLRAMYDQEYAEARASGFDEAIFMNERGEVTEGAISNIFIQQSGRLLTPPLPCGVLPGIFRRHLLETHANAEEKILTVADLHAADAIFLCNSLRGIREVKSLQREGEPESIFTADTRSESSLDIKASKPRTSKNDGNRE
jgi:para-aminobenzoate synthetase / 4-amino-4-deoxychorismate lyase